MPGDNVQGTGAALSRRQWKSADSASGCRVCGKEFKMFNKKHHCRHCGEVVCGDCSKLKVRLETFNKAKKALRVCDSCGEKFTSDKAHPLFALLGDKLGALYFYEFTKNGDDNIDQLCELSKDQAQFDVLLERNRVHKDHRKSILERIRAAYSDDSDDAAEDDEDTSDLANSNSPKNIGPPPPGVPTHTPRSVHGNQVVSQRGSLGPGGAGAGSQQLPMWKKLSMNKAVHVIKNKATVAQLSEEKDELRRQLAQQKSEVARLKLVEARLEAMEEERLLAQHEERLQKHKLECAKIEVVKKVKRRRRAFENNMHHKDVCELCQRAYTGGRWGGEHHCRMCFRSCCHTCSTGRVGELRSCDWCFAETVLASKDLMSSITGSRRQQDYWTHITGTLASSLQSLSTSEAMLALPSPQTTVAPTPRTFMSPRSDSFIASPRASEVNGYAVPSPAASGEGPTGPAYTSHLSSACE